MLIKRGLAWQLDWYLQLDWLWFLGWQRLLWLKAIVIECIYAFSIIQLGLLDSDLDSSLCPIDKLSVLLLFKFFALLLVLQIRLVLRALPGYFGLSTRFLFLGPRLSAGLFQVHLR